MNDVPLIQLIPIGTLVVLTIRLALGSLERAEAGFASLFVPTNRTLPWPRGVQESGESWAWRAPDPETGAERSAVPSVPVRRVR